MPTADYHLHTPLCKHASGHPRDYAQAALSNNLPEIGFSDHNPMPTHFDDWRMALNEFPDYLNLIQETQTEFAHTLPIKLGLEVDFLPDPKSQTWIKELSAKADFDYLIGSVHYIADDWAIDDPDPKWQSKWTDPEGVEQAWTEYWNRYANAITSGHFDILAHPDLPKKFGHRPEGDLRRFYEPAINAAAHAGIAFELSTAGLRKPCQEMYPARAFLELQRAADIPLVISSDAHQPASVGHAFPNAIALAKEIGFTHTLQFTKRQATPVPIP
ncbi:MAG: histidinol-phosphatase HisJ family protein [Verrucomicrobiota bacterium]